MSLVIFFMFALAGMEEADVPLLYSANDAKKVSRSLS